MSVAMAETAAQLYGQLFAELSLAADVGLMFLAEFMTYSLPRESNRKW